MNRETLQTIADRVGTMAYPAELIPVIESALIGEAGKHWNRDLRKLIAFCEDNRPRFTVYTSDTYKVPYLQYSTLPGVDCPGAGDCLSYCYSFKAWRYPAAFSRQVQNSIMLRTAVGRANTLLALDRHAPRDNRPIDFRLYVDGDFTNSATLAFWMDALEERPWLRAYGYTKSLKVFLSHGGDWPANYTVNLSSGNKYDSATVARFAALPVVRGTFDTVYIDRADWHGHGDKRTNRALRAAVDGPVFTCPGRCGHCTPKGHACGSARFAGVPIVIAQH